MTSRMRRLVPAALAVVFALGLQIPMASAADKAPPPLIVRDLPAQVRLAPGEKVRIVLPTNRTTGYSWHAEGGCCVKGTDLNVATVSKGVYTAPADAGMVGVAGTTTWTVAAKRIGTTTVAIVTRPPGVGNTMQDEEVGALTVIVQRP